MNEKSGEQHRLCVQLISQASLNRLESLRAQSTAFNSLRGLN